MPDYITFKNYITKLLKAKLDPNLKYHGFHHVKNVMDAGMMLAEKASLNNSQILLLKTAIMLHDSGFIHTYVDHESDSVKMAKSLLPDYGYSIEDIETISGMIFATKIPQLPKTELEEIIADADLEYLGTDSFDSISETLFEELMAFGFIKDRDQWNNIQVKFLSSHTYFTDFCKKNRESYKQQNLDKIKRLI